MPTERVAPEILLWRSDLPPKELVHDYVMAKEKFLELYKSEWQLYIVKDHLFRLLRLLEVIPIEIKADQILPSPFVVDT